MRTILKDRLGRAARSGSVVVAFVTAACPATTPTGPGTSPTAGPVTFNPVSQLQGTVGQAFTYSFCKPDLSSTASLCGTQLGGTTNPTGGQPTYHFQLGSGVGFPPPGVTLNLNGVLSGTPTTAGTSTFSVCAVDLAGKSACGAVTMTILGTVAVGQLSWTCTISATPLPGWRNCTATVGLTISKAIQSGYVSVFFNFPDGGAFFHGELAVAAGSGTKTVTVNLVNEYVSHCVTSYATKVDVYDGRQNAGQAPLLVSVPITLTSSCP
jgi:hypothetical protein